ncbi:MAG: threonine ammonia-lyase [Aggregatilineales bacterium]
MVATDPESGTGNNTHTGPDDSPTTLTVADIIAARKRLDGIVYRTPIVYSDALSLLCRCNLYLKLETLQKTGAFKVRGACNKVLSLGTAACAKGLVTASSGNHAQGVAFAARLSGLDDRTTIVVPRTTPATKLRNTRAYGQVKVELVGDSYDEASAYAHHLAQKQGAAYVEPYNDWQIMAGQGTLGLEIAEDLPDIKAVIVPVGGGGLIAGTALALKSRQPRVKVFGVAAPGSRLADGIRVKSMGEKPLTIINRYVDGLYRADDLSIAQAVVELAGRGKIVAEGAGAVGLAALLTGTLTFPANSRVVLVISGANIDPERLGELLIAAASHEPDATPEVHETSRPTR